MHRKSIYVVALILLSLPAWAQMPAKPGAEVKKLEYFVGSWSSEGTIGQGPWGAGGKFSSTSTMEWMAGDFFVTGHAEFKMPPELGGDGKAVAFIGYDTNQNVYTYDAFNSLGRRETSTGSVNADTWTWNSQASYGGQDIKQKMTMKVLSPTSYTFKLEVSLDGTTWMPFMDGKATRK